VSESECLSSPTQDSVQGTNVSKIEWNRREFKWVLQATVYSMENCAIIEVSTLLKLDCRKNINQSIRCTCCTLKRKCSARPQPYPLSHILAFKMLKLALLNMCTYMFQNIKLSTNECGGRSKTLQWEMKCKAKGK
jgi:hypothetical protein